MDGTRTTRLSDEEPNYTRANDPLEEFMSQARKLFLLEIKYVGAALFVIWAVEIILVCKNVYNPEDRIITEKVILAIIGATIIQLGAIVAGGVVKAKKIEKTQSAAAS